MAVVESVIFALALMCLGVVDPMEQRGITTFHSTCDETLINLVQEVTSLRSEQEATKKKMTTLEKGSAGSTYVRWGRTQCPPNSQLVYSGRAGGSYRYNPGHSANRLCLTMKPRYDSSPMPLKYGRLYGAEYLRIHGLRFHLTPCAVCHAAHVTTLMIPGTMNCPPGWTAQYSGYLSSEDHKHQSNAEYVCLDGHPQDVTENYNYFKIGTYFYHTVGMCGSLPCPPYERDRVITCVVCSK